MRPLRFCMLTTFYPPEGFGGDAIQTERLTRALAERGHEVTVVHSPSAYRALARNGGPKLSLAGGGSESWRDRVRVVRVDPGPGRLAPAATYLSGRPALTGPKLEAILAEGFDVVHFHNPSLLGGATVMRMGEGIKLYTAHEQWLVCPTHVLWKYQRRVCEKPQCWRCALTYGRPPQLWRSTGLLSRSVSQLDALIAPSRTVARLHERFASLVRIARLPHFVDERSDPGAGGSDQLEDRADGGVIERPYFLFAGRLERIKGVELLLEAFRRRRSEHLLIAGTGSLDRKLRRAAADLPHVRFLGWVSHSRLQELYRNALAVVVPTLGHESFGLVPVEAFALGTPAIVRRFGALDELAGDCAAAIGFSDERELDAALAEVAEDEKLRGELSARARDAFLRQWTAAVHLRGYFGLIAELARERGETELARLAEDHARSAELEAAV